MSKLIWGDISAGQQVIATDNNELTGTTMAYGSMYADDIVEIVTIGAANTYYEVSRSITGSVCDGLTFQSNKQLRCDVAGVYLINLGVSITSATNNENISAAAMVNSTEVHSTEGSAQCINSGKPVHVGGTGIKRLYVGDVVKFCVQNEDAAHNITVYHAHMSVVKIGP